MTLGSVKYKILKQTNPRLNIQRITDLKALYYGGARLLMDDTVLSRLFPRYTHEKDAVYAERKRRAYYENVFAQVVNQISAGLAQDPVVIADTAGVDEYWIQLMADATPFSEDGSKKKSFDQLMRDTAIEALVCGWSWLQADLPSAPPPDMPAPASLAEQEQSGGLRAYLIQWATECVIDWEEKNGSLLWVRTYQCEMISDSPVTAREAKRHTYTIWERDSWTRYEIIENTKHGQPLPGDEVDITPHSEGVHSFGRVPWTRLDLCAEEGVRLHLGDQIESLCRSYFNRQNGEAFQWVQFYFQQLYEFLGPEISGIDMIVSDAQSDPGRAKRTRAPGEVQVRGNEDSASFVGPSMAGASEGRAASQDLRDSIYRATAQMALSQDTSGAMLRRSADSKRQDAVAQEIVLGAIGKKILTMAKSVAQLMCKGRGDAGDPPEIRGYERFDITDADMLLDRASVVASINIPSATYMIEHLYQVAIADLGDTVSDQIKKKIRKELEMTITQDQMMSTEEKEAEDKEIEEMEGDIDDELAEEDEDEDGEKAKKFGWNDGDVEID